MSPHQSHLRPDGTVFPPVTPDPPPPPGQDEILVPELDPAAAKRAEERPASTRGDEVEDTGTGPSRP